MSFHTAGSRLLTMSASLYSGSCFSRKQPRDSSQWNVPLCVPILGILARFAEIPAEESTMRTRGALQRENAARINFDGICLIQIGQGGSTSLLIARWMGRAAPTLFFQVSRLDSVSAVERDGVGCRLDETGVRKP